MLRKRIQITDPGMTLKSQSGYIKNYNPDPEALKITIRIRNTGFKGGLPQGNELTIGALKFLVSKVVDPMYNVLYVQKVLTHFVQ